MEVEEEGVIDDAKLFFIIKLQHVTPVPPWNNTFQLCVCDCLSIRQFSANPLHGLPLVVDRH